MVFLAILVIFDFIDIFSLDIIFFKKFIYFDLINDKNNSKNPQDNEFIEICINGLVKKHLKFKKELIPKIDFNKNVDYGIKVKNGEIVYGLRYGGPEPGLNTKFLEFRDVDKRNIYSIKNPMNQIIRDLLKECIIWE